MKLDWTNGQRVMDADSGAIYDPIEVTERLPWRQQGGDNRPAELDPLVDMPLHQYVVKWDCNPTDWAALSFVIAKHPESYRAYFRGYKYPLRYLELGDRRYWATAPHGVQMLNRCFLDSVEPPRRVDQGARPICWQEWGAEEAYLPQDSGWSDEYRRKNPDLFDPERTPPCAHGVIEVDDRVKHLASGRYGTVVAAEQGSEKFQVRWDEGKTSWVGGKGLRTQCCLPREPFGPAPGVMREPTERPRSADRPRRSGGAGELHFAFWTELTSYLETKKSPVELGMPNRRSTASVPRGPSSFRLVPWNVLPDQTSGVWVRWDGPAAENVVARFQGAHRELLTGKLSRLGEVVWLSPDDKGSILSLRRPSDLADRRSWPELMAWLAGAMETIRVLLAELGETPGGDRAEPQSE